MLYDETQIAKAFRDAEVENNPAQKEKVCNGKHNKDAGLMLSNVTAKWSEASVENTLTGINIEVVLILHSIFIEYLIYLICRLALGNFWL